MDSLPPPPAIIRTVEEMGIQHPLPIDQKIIKVAKRVLKQFTNGNKIPVYNEISFTAASRKNRCQQNVRNLIEATEVFESKWKEASCCAGNTQRKMHQAAKNGKYIEITNISSILPGDIIYIGGGVKCSKCKSPAGHVMVYTGDNNGKQLMWQNTVYDGLKLCNIPLRQDQINRFIAAYRFIPKIIQKEKIIREELIVTPPPNKTVNFMVFFGFVTINNKDKLLFHPNIILEHFQ